MVAPGLTLSMARRKKLEVRVAALQSGGRLLHRRLPRRHRGLDRPRRVAPLCASSFGHTGGTSADRLREFSAAAPPICALPCVKPLARGRRLRAALPHRRRWPCGAFPSGVRSRIHSISGAPAGDTVGKRRWCMALAATRTHLPSRCILCTQWIAIEAGDASGLRTYGPASASFSMRGCGGSS